MAAHSCTSFRFADSVLHPATARANRPRAPTLAARMLPPDEGQLRMGWDSNPRNGYPFTRSPGVCLQPLGHPSNRPPWGCNLMASSGADKLAPAEVAEFS